MRVIAYTSGKNDPSARFRVRQYIDTLASHGVDLLETYSGAGSFPPAGKVRRIVWATQNLSEHLYKAFMSHKYDACLIQREFLSTYFTFEGLTKSPRILDIDDAIFLQRGGRAARKLAEHSDRVICGNSFLADWFSQYNKNIHIIPTAVDTSYYFPLERNKAKEDDFIIGWSGSSSNFKYLYDIEHSLSKVLASLKHARLKIIADTTPVFKMLPQEKIDFVKWSTFVEVKEIQTFDVGLMPLRDDDWSRGKCGYKMLTYMSCGVPSIVTPVGLNADILAMADKVGIGASGIYNWEDAIIEIYQSAELRRILANNGRQLAVNHFSKTVITPKLANVLSRSIVEL